MQDDTQGAESMEKDSVVGFSGYPPVPPPKPPSLKESEKGLDVFDDLQAFCDANFYVDVDDKLPIFLCSIGAHIFNTLNKCSRCDFDPEFGNPNDFKIPNCPLRHENAPFYTPMSRLADTRVHILIRGQKGSGKNVLIDLFCAEVTGLLYSAKADDLGIGFRTMIGPNSATEAGIFGSVNEDGEIVGRPLARETCGGFLCFEEFSSMVEASRKEHSTDMKNQLLTSLDSGRVNKGMRHGWVRYFTRYTMWAGTQPARFELESGLDRRFFIIDIEMTPERERAYKEAQNRQSMVTGKERAELAEKTLTLQKWFIHRMLEAVTNPPKSVKFDDTLQEWIMRDTVRSYEADLFRRLAIGYAMMQPTYEGGEVLEVKMDDRLQDILNTSLVMRRRVMDSDLALMKTTFWDSDLPKSQLIKEVSRMVTMGDYQSAKRWIDDNLLGQHWYREFIPSRDKRPGRKGVVCRFAANAHERDEYEWGGKNV